MKEYDMIADVLPDKILDYAQENNYEINVTFGRSLPNNGYVHRDYMIFSIIKPSVDGDTEVFSWFGQDGVEQESLEDGFNRFESGGKQ